MSRALVVLAALACCAHRVVAGSWHAVAPTVVKREAMGAGVLNGTLYVVGGVDMDLATEEPRPASGGAGGGGPYLASVEAYHLHGATDAWALVAPMSVTRFNVGVGVLGGLLYAVGGAAGTATTPAPLASVEAHHPANDSWAKVANMTVKRDGPGVGVLGGLLYAVGGQNDDGYEGLQVLQTVEAYNPITNTWDNRIAPMSVPRHDMGVGVLRGLLYAVGGASGDGPYLASMEAYDPITNTWDNLVAPMSVARVNLGVGVLGGLLYAVGGVDADVNVLASVEAYNPATNSWARVAPMSVERKGLGVGVLGGTLYAVGGGNFDNYALASVETFHPANDSWTSS